MERKRYFDKSDLLLAAIILIAARQLLAMVIHRDIFLKPLVVALLQHCSGG